MKNVYVDTSPKTPLLVMVNAHARVNGDYEVYEGVEVVIDQVRVHGNPPIKK